jgi:hypothetical protein
LHPAVPPSIAECSFTYKHLTTQETVTWSIPFDPSPNFKVQTNRSRASSRISTYRIHTNTGSLLRTAFGTNPVHSVSHKSIISVSVAEKQSPQYGM